MTSHGSSSQSETLWLHGGVTDVEHGTRRPAIAFGTFQAPGAAREFSYVLLLRYPPEDGAIGIAAYSGDAPKSIWTDRQKGTEDHGYKVGKHWVRVRYDIEVDPATRTVIEESLALEGRPVDLDSGRVFLVDGTGETPSIRQVRVSLPGNLPVPASATVIKQVVDQLLRTLPRESREIRDFVRSQEISQAFHAVPDSRPEAEPSEESTNDTTSE